MASSGGSTVGALVDKVAFVNKIPLLMKATSDDDTPTAGYMFGEITKWTLESGSYCLTLLDFLVDRLNRESCRVKLKVLKLLTYIVDNGHPDFRRGLRKHPHGIHHATKCNGPADPLHGHALYQLVRQAAVELNQMLFDVREDEDERAKEYERPKMSGMGGFTSDSCGTAADQMQGFGSSMPIAKSLGESIVSGLRDLADRVIDPVVSSPEYRPSSTPNRYKPPPVPLAESVRRSPPEAPITMKLPQPRRNVPVHTPGRAGGGWEDSDEEDAALPQCTSDSAASPATPSAESVQSSKDRNDDVRMAEFPAVDWATEVALVTEFSQMSGLATRKQIDVFMKSCSSLNCEEIVKEIGNQLSSANFDEQQMRLMLLIERFLRHDMVALDHVAHSCIPALGQIFNMKTGPPYHKARKIIRILEKLCTSSDVIEALSIFKVKCTPEKSKMRTDEMLTRESYSANLLTREEDESEMFTRVRQLSETLLDEETSPDWLDLKIPFSCSDGDVIKSDPLLDNMDSLESAEDVLITLDELKHSAAELGDINSAHLRGSSEESETMRDTSCDNL